MIECSRCLNTENNSDVPIDSSGLCEQCQTYQKFTPFNEDVLLKLFEKVKSKKRKYQALVPISGGKDSTYVLYLAIKKYGLNVLTYTYDNGFLSDLARENIERSVKKMGVDHIWYSISNVKIYQLYKRALTASGEICGVCGVAIERSMIKVSEQYQIPLILLGHSPAEDNSFTAEPLYDPNRLKAILKSDEIKKENINDLLIYPNLNYITSYLLTKMGKFGQKVNILYYQEVLTDDEIANIIKKELDWKDADYSSYTRHLDCLAEPFTNYIRDHRIGSSRRLPQLNNMIRNGEISRKEAIEIQKKDKNNSLPLNYEWVKSRLKLNDTEIEETFNIPLGVYSQHESKANRLFAMLRKFLKTH